MEGRPEEERVIVQGVSILFIQEMYNVFGILIYIAFICRKFVFTALSVIKISIIPEKRMQE